MKPAISVILLTTLIGVGQGMFIALFCAEVFGWTGPDDWLFFVYGSITSFVFLGAGLLASFFHLGRPERAWRAAAMWRTSWLSREVIVLPVAMLFIAAYAGALYMGQPGLGNSTLTLLIGAVGAAVMLILYLCTGMIYACIRFLQEWASPLTVANFTFLGLSSGFLLASGHAAEYAPAASIPLAYSALGLLLFAFLLKLASLWRNRRIKPKTSLQSAIGIRHTHIRQQSVGFMGGSFNTREFFHGRSQRFVDLALQLSLALTFALPALLCGIGLITQSFQTLTAAFIVHFTGLLLERWLFFAQANHPQNLYYQTD